uniref:Wall-associated receptor kinase galacturonan-binding domain-containing protein n=1 Tax=Aegilops tauschii TaxID=37682 RepID=M8B4N0_AEGTA
MTPLQTLLLLLVFYAALLTTAVSGAPSPSPASAPPVAKSCPGKCGEIDIPYPFGIGPGCSLSGRFALTCNETTSPPTLLRRDIKVANITLETAQMVVYTHLTYSCDLPSSKNTSKPTSTRVSAVLRVRNPFLLSASANVFTAIGCRSTARLRSRSVSDYLTGCITTCLRVNDTGDDGTPCNGHGCCETSLISRLNQVNVSWSTRALGTNPVPESPCQYAFVSTKGWNVDLPNMFGTRNGVRIDNIHIHGFNRKLSIPNKLPAQLIGLLRKLNLHQSTHKMDPGFPTVSGKRPPEVNIERDGLKH